MIRRVTILLVFVFQIFNSYCTRKVLSERTSLNAEEKIEKKQSDNVRGAGMINKSVPAAISTVSVKDNAGSDVIPRSSSSPAKSYGINFTADEIINTARMYLGVPHCWRRTSSACMDCSGLLVTVFGKYGIQLPHNSEEQSSYGKKISAKSELKKGDLVFFIKSYKTTRYITHSGIYIGNGKFIHTSSSSGVTITSLNDPWWKERFIFGTRILDQNLPKP